MIFIPSREQHACSLLCHVPYDMNRLKNSKKLSGKYARFPYGIFFFCLSCMLFIATPLFASVTLKISASNPSSFSEKIVPVKAYLPKGILPEHVIDSSGLNVDFDEKQEQTYVHKEMNLKPREEASFNVEIEDIWLFDNEMLDDLRDQTRTIVNKLEQTEYVNKALQIKNAVEGYLDELVDTQDKALITKTGPIEHISAYEINKESLALIKESIKELEELLRVSGENELSRQDALREGKTGAERIHTQEIKEKLLTIDESGASGCLVTINLEEEKEAINFDAPKTSSFRVVIENPSTIEKKTVPVRYFLTKEIKGRDVVETSGLKIGFDPERKLFYVYSKGVDLDPGETKVFDIILNNRWTIDKRNLYASKVYIESMLRTASNAKEVEEEIRKMGAEATNKCNELLKREEMAELSGKGLESFRNDKDNFAELERLIRNVEDLLLQAGISPADSLIEQEQYCVKAKAEGLTKEQMEAGLNASTVLETQRIKSLAGTIFKGKSVSGASTWKIINYIIVFLGLISSVFYFVNIRQQKSTMFDPLTGAFARAYILDRLQEELKIAKGGGSKCSVLVMDIDKFKGINDTHGHAAGDAVLKEFVIAIRKGVRATDLIGRFGGDEFVIVLPTSEKKTAIKIAESIARIVEGTVITISPKLSVNITSSIGVATYPDDSKTSADIFDKADQSLYEVKKRGGNGVVAFGWKA